MKKFTLVFLFFAGLMLNLRADILVTLPDITASPGTQILVPVKIYGASETGTPITTADIRFNFNTAVLTYTGITNFTPLMPANQWVYAGNNGLVSANWLEPNFNAVAIPDGTTLYEVKFTVIGGSCPFPFNLIEFADENYNVTPSSGDDGSFASVQQVTFKVDMRDQTVSPQGVHVAGSFNSWSPSATSMSAAGTVYSVTQALISGTNYTFRFVNGNTTAGYEIVPATCGAPGTGGLYDRTLTVPAYDTVMTAVCFGSCEACPPLVDLSFRVDMSQQTLNPQGVFVAGSFNAWSTTATPLANLGNNVFGATIQVIPGTQVQFRYLNGNTSANYEIVPAACGVPGTGGVYNRVVTPVNDLTLPEVCFSSCSDCPLSRNLTLKVDMSELSISSNGVHVAGSFNGNSPSATPMSNLGNNVFTVTLTVFENDFITYRFVNGNTSAGFETVPSACGIPSGAGGNDRFVQMGSNDTLMAEVCFSSCTDCAGNPDETAVTFVVDMSKENIASSGVFLAGSFNNWNPSSHPMLPLGNDVYGTTLNLIQNTNIQYRFSNGNTAQGYETVPSACGTPGVSGGNERTLTVPEEDITLPEVCFSMCEDCPPATTYNVTFRVDMSRQTVGVYGVHLAGDFNNWSTSSTQMIFNTNTELYEKSLTFEEGTTLLFRYVNGADATGLETVPALCGVTYGSGAYARTLTVTADTLLEGICFGDCFPCDVSVEEATMESVFGRIFPNPATHSVTLPVHADPEGSVSVVITDIAGRTAYSRIYTISEGSHPLIIDTSSLKPGMYILKAEMQAGNEGLLMNRQTLLIAR